MSRKFWSLCLAALLVPCTASATDETEQGLATLWEVLWHQSGTPTRIVRWENDIRVRMTGVELPRHREHIGKALREVTEVAGVRLIDVTDQPGEFANLTVEITPDMVGQKVAVAHAIEIKAGGSERDLSADQKRFREIFESMGGIYEVET